MFALAPSPVASAFAGDVISGLLDPAQKSVPSRWLYDDLGSTLFEAITLLPEYGLTRADARVLQANAGNIADAMAGDVAVAELGSGSGVKTRWILEALAARRSVDFYPIDYYPIDVSASALGACRAALEQIGGVRILEQNASYLDGLGEAAARRAPHQKLLVLFLGSTIGNFDSPAAREFLVQVRSRLAPGDALLLGTDLVKPLPQMVAAYDDPLGVTAAFNLNLLVRMNRELDADFDVRQFAHKACFNQEESRIEMHIRSRRAQTVSLRAIDRRIEFLAGETIWTEGSYKFRREEVLVLAAAAGFVPRAQWLDAEWPFAETLMIAQ